MNELSLNTFILFLFVGLAAFGFRLNAQTEPSKDLFISLSLNYFSEPIEAKFFTSNSQNNTGQEIEFIDNQYLSPGFSIGFNRSNNWFHEFSLVRFRLGADEEIKLVEFGTNGTVEPIEGRARDITNINLRWEIGKYFVAQPRIKLGAALAIDPHLFYARTEPFTSANFPSEIALIDFNLMLVPRLQIKLSEKLDFLAKIPFEFFSYGWESTTLDNPTVPDSRRTFSLFDLDVGLSNVQLMAGLLFKL